jgi:hypothetical protein
MKTKFDRSNTCARGRYEQKASSGVAAVPAKIIENFNPRPQPCNSRVPARLAAAKLLTILPWLNIAPYNCNYHVGTFHQHHKQQDLRCACCSRSIAEGGQIAWFWRHVRVWFGFALSPNRRKHEGCALRVQRTSCSACSRVRSLSARDVGKGLVSAFSQG